MHGDVAASLHANPVGMALALGCLILAPYLVVCAAVGRRFCVNDFEALLAKRDRGEAVTAMSRGAPIVLARLAEEKKIDGVISLEGGGGSAISTAAMRALPIGFPKLMVTTLASGNTAQYVGTKDIVMFPSIVDVAGLNRISREILERMSVAAHAGDGMLPCFN